MLQEVASGPPEGWQLTETPGDTHLTLKKTDGSEKLQIDLMVNDQARTAVAIIVTAVASLQLNIDLLEWWPGLAYHLH